MKKILICEDEKEVQNLLKTILLKNKYKVHTAADGKEAIEQAREIKPDLILLDIRMPKLDGLEVAKEIRKFNTKVGIVFITGFQSPELSKEASKYNISGYIVKPSPTKEILQTIKGALK
jgi:two-component system, OmpR family, response regulator VicR